MLRLKKHWGPSEQAYSNTGFLYWLHGCTFEDIGIGDDGYWCEHTEVAFVDSAFGKPSCMKGKSLVAVFWPS